MFRGMPFVIQNVVIAALGSLMTGKLYEELDKVDFVALILNETSDILT